MNIYSYIIFFVLSSSQAAQAMENGDTIGEIC